MIIFSQYPDDQAMPSKSLDTQIFQDAKQKP
jgi:hypothetical protein